MHNVLAQVPWQASRTKESRVRTIFFSFQNGRNISPGKGSSNHHLQNDELPVPVRAPGTAIEHRHRRLSGQLHGSPAVIGGGQASSPISYPIALFLLLGRRVDLLLVPRQL